MTQKRNTQVYKLKQGNEVVYMGTTNDPERREQEHRGEGKKFTKLETITRKMTEEGAKKQEAERIGAYRRNQGRNPKYNKDSNG